MPRDPKVRKGFTARHMYVTGITYTIEPGYNFRFISPRIRKNGTENTGMCHQNQNKGKRSRLKQKQIAEMRLSCKNDGINKLEKNYKKNLR